MVFLDTSNLWAGGVGKLSRPTVAFGMIVVIQLTRDV